MMLLKIKLIIGAILLTVAFFSGYTVRNHFAQLEKAQAVETALLEERRQAKVNRQADAALLSQQQRTRIVYKTITKEVPKYVTKIQKDDSDCNVSRGVVRLLNHTDNELPDTTGNDVAKDTRASEVREADLIQWAVEIKETYQQSMQQCNALIDWHRQIQGADSDRGT